MEEYDYYNFWENYFSTTPYSDFSCMEPLIDDYPMLSSPSFLDFYDAEAA
ncbi:unnamed protein product, partial [Cuscuta epithymum]